jgi:hypothetical protein
LAKLNVIGVVELDDRTHERFERGVRDGLVDAALADAGIPVLRVAAKASYSPVEIRQKIKEMLQAK